MFKRIAVTALCVLALASCASADSSYSTFDGAVEDTFQNISMKDFTELCEHVTPESAAAASSYGAAEPTCESGWGAKLMRENVETVEDGWNIIASNLPKEGELRGAETVTVYAYGTAEQANSTSGSNSWVVFENGAAAGVNIQFMFDADAMEWVISSTP